MASIEFHAEYVRKYNALPRRPKAPSGRVPNVWHFDLRYIPISPPSHMLFIFQKDSQLIASQTLPVTEKLDETGLAYFPETAEQAALEICLGLMHYFISGSGVGPNAPWSLTTDDLDLARAVQAQFKALGVKEERCQVNYVGNITGLVQYHFNDLYEGMKGMLDYSLVARAALTTPQSIAFSNMSRPDSNAWAFSVPPSFYRDEPEMKEVQKLADYVRDFANNEPTPVNQDASPDFQTRFSRTLEQVKAVVDTNTLDQVRKKADAGDPQQAIDAALRLKYGLQCNQDATLSRDYLIKAALDREALVHVRSMAHSMLVSWYIAGRGDDFRVRYLFAASYHADEAIRLVSENSPLCSASPAVLGFGSGAFANMTVDLKVPELLVHFKWIVKASEQRTMYMKLQDDAFKKKMMKKPNRYRCANLGCGIESDTGKMLSQCAGQCDRDKKPSYCSKTRPYIKPTRNITCLFHFTEKEDWKIHKPFCRPGAPCSVIDTTINPGGAANAQGSIRLPVHHANGSTTVISTSTLDPELLKQMRDVALQHEDGSFGKRTRIEILEI
ncbi:hypothetical protein D9757_006923 [Collybiopsis confluens]|uniref:MYND-type domain-containing protein n=1 Tax=Collybiopsis confluens TaxID=2823264 RepID=A0A8H5HIK0_9AGAR|nr:hypothetical protein D9757_006923 [Collybiopsis confluens]